jgi:hypothetical protein
MNLDNLIPVTTLCTHYNVEMPFFGQLNEMGLIQIQIIEETQYIHPDRIYEIEKIIRLYQELDINIEGIDVIMNLLKKIDDLQNELIAVKNRLGIYES